MAPGNIRRSVRTPGTRAPHSSGTPPMNALNSVRMPGTRSPHSSAAQSMNGPNPEASAPVRNIRKCTVNNFLKKYRKATNNSKPRIELNQEWEHLLVNGRRHLSRKLT